MRSHLFTMFMISMISSSISSEDNITSSRLNRDVYFPGRYGSARSHSNCDTTITQKEGWISSPNFPSNYDNSLHCTFFVVKYSNDVCAIQITFTDFDIEDTPDCANDYLELGPNSGRMCGVLLAETKKKISFARDDNTLRFVFHSDAYNSRKGFMARVTQLRNTCAANNPDYQPRPSFSLDRTPQTIYLGSFCDIYIGDTTGDLRSPPDLENNQTCLYTIRRAAADVCRVEFIFNEFDFVSSGGQRYVHCDTAYLQMPDRQRLCGQLAFHRRSYYYPQTSDYLLIHFNSGRKFSRRQQSKFWIEVRQIRNSCDYSSPPDARKCDQTLSGRVSQVIQSPNYPQPYSPLQQCLYMVVPIDRNVCEFELYFNRFSLESSANITRNCYRDYFYLPDGSVICGMISGKRSFWFPNYRDRVAMFYFASDANIEDRGYEITVTQFPNSCGNTGLVTNAVRPVTSPPSLRPVRPIGPVRPDIPVVESCDKIYSQEVEIITSPNYPSNYPPISRCIYTILKSGTNVCQIRVDIFTLDLEYTNGCVSDYLLIETTGERLCGRLDGPQRKFVNFPNYSREIRLIFNSDRQTVRPGFEIRVEQVPNSCNHPITPPHDLNGVQTVTDTGVSPQTCGSSAALVSIFQSDNYPLAYNSDTDCTYSVLRANPQVCRLEIFFDDFEVGNDLPNNRRVCSDDYIEIEGLRYCGRRKGERFTINFPLGVDEMAIRFRTDSYDRFAGFRIQVRQIDDKCRNAVHDDFSPGSTEACHKMTFSERSLQILSPNYESGSYRPFLDCEYIIRKSNYNVCALQVKYNAFSLEDSKSCQKDYLQIGEMKLCGRLPFQAIRTYEFANDEMSIKFHTDSDVNDAGFVILVNQIQC